MSKRTAYLTGLGGAIVKTLFHLFSNQASSLRGDDEYLEHTASAVLAASTRNSDDAKALISEYSKHSDVACNNLRFGINLLYRNFGGHVVSRCLSLPATSSRQCTRSRKNASPLNERTIRAVQDLTEALPHVTFQRSHPALYKSVKSYWSNQAQELIPACVVKPDTVDDVSIAVKILSDHVSRDEKDLLHFAVRSGGHSPTKGYANVEGGIVVDLSALNAVSISDDRKTVNVGPGARWLEVYNKLESAGLAVVGGRAASVGVGGLLLGGGLSFLSPQFGFACDNILSFQVVLADGKILTADERNHADLARVLRGGGNNFGIVTRFTLRAVPLGKMFGGYRFFYAGERQKLLRVYHDFCNPRTYDRNSNCIMTVGYGPIGFVHVGLLQHMKPDKDPLALKGFTSLRYFWSTLHISTLSKVTTEIDNLCARGQRQLFHTTTFENNLEMIEFAYDKFRETAQGIKKAKGISWGLCYQPLTPWATMHSDRNAMGVKSDKTLVIVHVSASWNRESDDAAVVGTSEKLIDMIEQESKRRGVFNAYKYANYSSASQDPYAGYGAERREHMREVSRKYDPGQLFQRGVQGCFKL